MSLKLKKTIMIGALLLPLAGAHAAGNVQGKRFGDWGGQCETIKQTRERVCYLQQVLSEKADKKPTMVTVVGYGKGKKFPTAIFDLPKGVDMRQGVQLRVDRYNAVSFKGKCDQQGCRAGFTLDNPLTQQFQKGKRALIAFKRNGQKDPVLLPVSLKGMSVGLRALR